MSDKFSLRRGNLMVSLTDDAYDYNDKYFTLEITEMDGDEGIENDAAESCLPITASLEEIAAYLSAALIEAAHLAGTDLNIRRTAEAAAEKGLAAVAKKEA